MAGKRRHFGKRSFQVGDDGDAFEAFTFECFRFARDERGFSKRLARGRDGAIDLLDCLSEPGSATVVECKYIGSEDAKEAPGRWAKVYQNLANNLPKLNADLNVTPTSPYRAWLDSKRPITRYRFCVSAVMSSAEIDALEARIVANFGQLVAEGVEQLRHLAEAAGAVRVIAWNWFEAELDEHPALAFRWFRGLPIGVDLFTNRLGSKPTFRDFLESSELRYFSRNEYVSKTGEPLDRGEPDFAAVLAEGRPSALLITGPGGVGKTRLSLELAATLASDAYGFDVYRLGRSADFDSVTELAHHYPTDRSILLLVDYAEALPALAGVADALAHLQANTKHRFRLIATCRSSANTSVRDSLAPLDPAERSLSSARTGEADYVAWVTRSILSIELFPDPANLAQVCNGVPALAAFALFLYRRHREQFDLQFGVLHGLGDFEKWFSHRIEMLIGPLGNRRDCERALAHIALALPIPVERYQMFSQQWGLLLDSLKVDRWIEYNDEAYHAVHDVFADALASRWLFEAEHVATDHALELLDMAAGRLDLAHALTALERLASHHRFVEIDGRRIVDALLAKHPEQTVACCGLILAGKLLKLEAKLAMLHQSLALQELIQRDRSLDGVVSHLATEAVHSKLNLVDCPELGTLSDLLDHACNQPQFSNMVLRRAYSLDSERFHERALASVLEFRGAEQTHFLSVQMLKHGIEPSIIESSVKHWLERHSTAQRATFLYRAWLEAGGGTEVVAGALLAWIGVHGLNEDAQFVYRAWLEAGGNTEAVAGALLAWIDVHSLNEDAQFVYCAWLKAGGSTEAVAGALLKWIDVHGQAESASFTYSAWLEAGGNTEAVAAALRAWVDVHGVSEDAQFVYYAWLKAGGSAEAVAVALRAWVDVHGHTESAQFVYSAWLEAGGGTEAVAAALRVWFDVYGQTENASFAYCTWLEAGGSIEAVATALLAWVDAHGQTKNAQFVYRAWLEAEGALEPIIEHVVRSVETWSHEPDFVYLSKILTKQRDLPETIVLAIAGWCEAFPEHEDCLYRISSLVSHLSEEALSVAGRSALLECIATIASSRDYWSIPDRRLIWTLCQSLVGRGHYYNLDPIGTIRAVCSIVTRGAVFGRDLSDGGVHYLAANHGMQVMLVRQGLKLGMLHLERDKRGLARFAAWLRAYAPAYLQRLQAEFPSDTWQSAKS